MTSPPNDQTVTRSGATRNPSVRGLALVLLLGTILLQASVFEKAPAVTPSGAEVIHLPVRWCAVDGSPAVENPAQYGQVDTDNVLMRRQERASHFIYIPGALLTTRSAMTETVADQADFPVIDDPAPNPGDQGDIRDPGEDLSELLDAHAACLAAWDELETQFNVNLEGIIGIQVRRFVTANGDTSNTAGVGVHALTLAAGQTTTDACMDPQANVVSNNGDGAFFATIQFGDWNVDPHERLLAHELGHVLFLGHGNGLDDDNNQLVDQFCDPAEITTAPPFTVMYPGLFNATDVLTDSQEMMLRAIAEVTSGAQVDPPGRLDNLDTVSDQRIDRTHDVSEASFDLVSAGFVHNVASNTISISHRPFSTVRPDAMTEFAAFLDLDDNPATGGSPLTIGYSSRIRGVELITSVVMLPKVHNLPRRMIPLVWRHDGTTFVPVLNRGIGATLATSIEPESGSELFDTVSIQMPLAVVAPFGERIGIRALARDLKFPHRVDYLPDLTDDNGILRLSPPTFPVAVATPYQVQAGQMVTVTARGLLPEQGVEVFIGGERVAVGIADGEGGATIAFAMPVAEPGPRGITMVTRGTALSADAVVEVARSSGG